MKQDLLMIIDMQEGFRYLESEKIIDNIKHLHSVFSIIAMTKFIDRPGSIFEKQLNWTTLQSEEKQKLMSEFVNIKANVFNHTTYNPLTEDFRTFVIERGIDRVFIAGIYTDVSVLVSAMLLFDMGLEVFVVKDACNSVHKNQVNNLHMSAIESLTHVLGKDHVVETKGVISLVGD